MHEPARNILNTTLIITFIVTTLSLAGCGDSDMAKGITDVVKKSVEGEVTKTGEEIKKQIDQVINLGTGKSQNEEGQGDAGAGKESSGEESTQEKD